jgi:hypothetical protein
MRGRHYSAAEISAIRTRIREFDATFPKGTRTELATHLNLEGIKRANGGAWDGTLVSQFLSRKGMRTVKRKGTRSVTTAPETVTPKQNRSNEAREVLKSNLPTPLKLKLLSSLLDAGG